MQKNNLYKEGGSMKRNNWDNLSYKDKAEIMKVAIANGITVLPEIKNAYNKFANGGNINSNDSEYYDYLSKLADKKAKDWGEDPDKVFLDMLNDNTYNYRAFWDNDREAANKMLTADPEAHFTDIGKTVYHPTFSNESIYSGKVSDYNPRGTIGGSWDNSDGVDWYIPSRSQFKNNDFSLERTEDYLNRNGSSTFLDMRNSPKSTLNSTNGLSVEDLRYLQEGLKPSFLPELNNLRLKEKDNEILRNPDEITNTTLPEVVVTAKRKKPTNLLQDFGFIKPSLTDDSIKPIETIDDRIIEKPKEEDDEIVDNSEELTGNMLPEIVVTAKRKNFSNLISPQINNSPKSVDSVDLIKQLDSIKPFTDIPINLKVEEDNRVIEKPKVEIPKREVNSNAWNTSTLEVYNNPTQDTLFMNPQKEMLAYGGKVNKDVSTNQQRAMRYLLSKGMNEIGAYAILGTLQAESGLNPSIKAKMKGDDGEGLAQWTGSRKKDFWDTLERIEPGSRKKYKNIVDVPLERQLDVILQERPEITQAINNSRTIDQATHYMLAGYENGGGGINNMASKQQIDNIYGKWNNGYNNQFNTRVRNANNMLGMYIDPSSYQIQNTFFDDINNQLAEANASSPYQEEMEDPELLYKAPSIDVDALRSQIHDSNRNNEDFFPYDPKQEALENAQKFNTAMSMMGMQSPFMGLHDSGGYGLLDYVNQIYSN